MKSLLLGILLLGTAANAQDLDIRDLIQNIEKNTEYECQIKKKVSDKNQKSNKLIDGGIHCRRCPAESPHCLPRPDCDSNLYEQP